MKANLVRIGWRRGGRKPRPLHLAGPGGLFCGARRRPDHVEVRSIRWRKDDWLQLYQLLPLGVCVGCRNVVRKIVRGWGYK